MDQLPQFDSLPEIPELGLRHAWDVWGRDDVLGSMNHVTPERVAAAASLVRSGVRVSLDLPLNLPNPPLFGREAYEHVVFPLNRNEMDDRLNNFHPQGSTQWDALNHVRCREHGYWGGRTQDPTDGPMGLGIDQFADHGIAGRGVLIDIAGWFERTGEFDPLDPRPITVSMTSRQCSMRRESNSRKAISCVFGLLGVGVTLPSPNQSGLPMPKLRRSLA